MGRFVSIWFRYLVTDWFTRRQPLLEGKAFVLKANDHGRAIITATNEMAAQQGLERGMVVADAKAMVSGLEVLDDVTGLPLKILTAMGHWCVRFSPYVAIDLPDGLLLDASGCTHLWGGERAYLEDIKKRFSELGYHVSMGMADTIGCAWAISRFEAGRIVAAGQQAQAMLPLPPSSLRLPVNTLRLLEQLGLNSINSFINIERSALRRRFGAELLRRLDQALGYAQEVIVPLVSVRPYQERLPCLEPIVSRKGIEIALSRLLHSLCQRLRKEEKGLRTVSLHCYRADRSSQQIQISTSQPSNNEKHVMKLFELKLAQIEPGAGIELFVLDVTATEDAPAQQERIWQGHKSISDQDIAELVDRLESRLGQGMVERFLPAEHHLPERAVRLATSLLEQVSIAWRTDRVRPVHLLMQPEPIQVSAPIPDYPPMLFRYRDQVHRIKRADGPERIECEWWRQKSEHRDYYVVEDEQGRRYWIFRLGYYEEGRESCWYIHGFFA